jgi:hypothetical protein
MPTVKKEVKAQVKGRTTGLTLPKWFRKMLSENHTNKFTDPELNAKAKAEFGDYSAKLTARRARKIYNQDKVKGIRGLNRNMPASIVFTKE